jgi:hypothetical protein
MNGFDVKYQRQYGQSDNLSTSKRVGGRKTGANGITEQQQGFSVQ